MVDDVFFDLLHHEMVNVFTGTQSSDAVVRIMSRRWPLLQNERLCDTVFVFFCWQLVHFDVPTTFNAVLFILQSELNVSKLEQVGFMTGYRFSEKSTKDCQRFKDELDVMKFICKEFWSSLFKKQIDNLRTNHQGVYVLLDNKFRFLTQVSASKQYLELVPKYLAFTCGLIRGALSNLGVVSIVTAEVVQSPSCRFQVQVQRS